MPDKTTRPAGTPKRIPAWAWKRLRLPGRKPQAGPRKLPKWFYPWRAWRLAHHQQPKPRPKPKPKPRTILLREKLVRAEIAAAKLGIHEIGADNHGPWVKKFLAETGLPEGYSWCDAFQSYEEHGVAGHKLPIESASVAQTYETAKRLGWLVKTPKRGDLGCVNWKAPGPPFGDHILLVVRAIRVGPMLTLQTVEGNTGPETGAGRDGVYLRTRVISARQVAFVRIPGKVAGKWSP